MAFSWTRKIRSVAANSTSSYNLPPNFCHEMAGKRAPRRDLDDSTPLQRRSLTLFLFIGFSSTELLGG